MKVKPQGKTDLIDVNPNEMLVRVQKPSQGLKVKTHIKAGRVIVFLDTTSTPAS